MSDKSQQTIAEKVLAARDGLLVARAKRKAAKKAFNESCEGMYFYTENGLALRKFYREIEDNCYGITVITWGASKEYLDHDPIAEQYRDDCTSHPDFLAMCKAKEALREANKQHGIALKRLLSIGVVRKGVA